MVEKLIRALFTGLIVGIIVGIVLALISMLIPRFEIDASWWGFIAGVLTALYVFITDERVVR